jgi:hypothetical protein
MPETVKAAVAVIGIDIGKNSFHVSGQWEDIDGVPVRIDDALWSHAGPSRGASPRMFAGGAEGILPCSP